MKTLVLEKDWLNLNNLPKDIRHEINRGTREGLIFKEIIFDEHKKNLRQYRKRKGLLMPPFKLPFKRRYFGIYTINNKYCCSFALYKFKDGYLVIQGVSIDSESPYYAFSYLIYNSLKLSIEEGNLGLDLAGPADWKFKWNPKELMNSFPNPKKSLTGGRITKILAKLYWRFFK
ncbi:MAG: hypothetical protein PHH82_03240 [Candidatus ainarchaeum sp.]|nr:hypothetical protein [Candidatus ainarchaeum sp.]